MRIKSTLFIVIIVILFSVKSFAQPNCDKARNFTHKNGQAKAFGADFYLKKCQCVDQGVSNKEDEKQLIAMMKYDRENYANYSGSASDLGSTPTSCKMNVSDNTNGGQLDNKTATQREIENRFQNYNTAMSLKNQGEAIAKAFAEQVKQYGEMGYASNPQEQLDNFNYNMQQIAQMQSQNKTDNLNQINNTLGTAINQLNSGNGEGALFSTLSLLDQRYEQKEAKKEAERQKLRLIAQQQQKMSQFYWKAVELNNKAINNYLQIAAYSFSKTDEDYNMAYATHHRCFGNSMQNNYDYASTQWTQNNCSAPAKTNHVENNLVSKDIQYINAAKRKFTWFEGSANEDFREGAMRFAGAAVTDNPKAEYYYLMGHYAGVANPLVAYTSFEAAKSLDSNYFIGTKEGEYYAVSQAIQVSFKEAIEINNQEVIKNIIASQLHKAVKIEGQPAILYAISIDQADVVQLFLNDYANGKSQSIVETKVQETIMMAAALGATKTIKRFIDMGFSSDFTMLGNSPIEVAEKANAFDAFDLLLNSSENKSTYISKFEVSNSILLIGSKIIDASRRNANNDILANYQKLETFEQKEKVAIKLFELDLYNGLGLLLENDNSLKVILEKPSLKGKIEIEFFKGLYKRERNIVSSFIKHGFFPIDKYGALETDFYAHMVLYNGFVTSGVPINEINEELLNESTEEFFSGVKLRGFEPTDLSYNLLNYFLINYLDYEIIAYLIDNYSHENIKFMANSRLLLANSNIINTGGEQISPDIIKFKILSTILDNPELKNSFFSEEDVNGEALRSMVDYLLGDYFDPMQKNLELVKKVNSKEDYDAGKKVVDKMYLNDFKRKTKKWKYYYLYKMNKGLSKYVWDVPWKKDDKGYWKLRR